MPFTRRQAIAGAVAVSVAAVVPSMAMAGINIEDHTNRWIAYVRSHECWMYVDSKTGLWRKVGEA